MQAIIIRIKILNVISFEMKYFIKHKGPTAKMADHELIGHGFKSMLAPFVPSIKTFNTFSLIFISSGGPAIKLV